MAGTRLPKKRRLCRHPTICRASRMVLTTPPAKTCLILLALPASQHKTTYSLAVRTPRDTVQREVARPDTSVFQLPPHTRNTPVFTRSILKKPANARSISSFPDAALLAVRWDSRDPRRYLSDSNASSAALLRYGTSWASKAMFAPPSIGPAYTQEKTGRALLILRERAAHPLGATRIRVYGGSMLPAGETARLTVEMFERMLHEANVVSLRARSALRGGYSHSPSTAGNRKGGPAGPLSIEVAPIGSWRWLLDCRTPVRKRPA